MADPHIWVTHRQRFDQMLAPYDLPLLEAAAPEPGETVIDVGCGTGTTTLQVADRVGITGHVFGIDNAGDVTAVAQRRLADAGVKNATIVTGDATTYSYRPAEADLILSRFATMLFPRAVPAHRHLFEALRPGGRLATVVWQSLERNLWHALPLRAVLAQVDLGPPGQASNSGPFAFADPDQLHATLEAAGFVDISIEPVEQPVRIGSDTTDAIAFFDEDAGSSLRRLATAETIDRIHEALAALLQPYAHGGDVVVPAAAWLTTARR